MGILDLRKILSKAYFVRRPFEHKSPPYDAEEIISKCFPEIELIKGILPDSQKAILKIVDDKTILISNTRLEESYKRMAMMYSLYFLLEDWDYSERFESAVEVIFEVLKNKLERQKYPWYRQRNTLFAEEVLVPLHHLDQMVDFPLHPYSVYADFKVRKRIGELARWYVVPEATIFRRLFDLSFFRKMNCCCKSHEHGLLNLQRVMYRIHYQSMKVGFHVPPFSTEELFEELYPEVNLIDSKLSRRNLFGVLEVISQVPSIYISNTVPKSVKRLTLLHELSHYLEDYQSQRIYRAECDVLLRLASVKLPDLRGDQEVRCDYFSREFLIPVWDLDQRAGQKISLVETEEARFQEDKFKTLAQFYDVPLGAVKNQIYDLNLLRKSHFGVEMVYQQSLS